MRIHSRRVWKRGLAEISVKWFTGLGLDHDVGNVASMLVLIWGISRSEA